MLNKASIIFLVLSILTISSVVHACDEAPVTVLDSASCVWGSSNYITTAVAAYFQTGSNAGGYSITNVGCVFNTDTDGENGFLEARIYASNQTVGGAPTGEALTSLGSVTVSVAEAELFELPLNDSIKLQPSKGYFLAWFRTGANVVDRLAGIACDEVPTFSYHNGAWNGLGADSKLVAKVELCPLPAPTPTPTPTPGTPTPAPGKKNPELRMTVNGSVSDWNPDAVKNVLAPKIGADKSKINPYLFEDRRRGEAAPSSPYDAVVEVQDATDEQREAMKAIPDDAETLQALADALNAVGVVVEYSENSGDGDGDGGDDSSASGLLASSVFSSLF